MVGSRVTFRFAAAFRGRATRPYSTAQPRPLQSLLLAAAKTSRIAPHAIRASLTTTRTYADDSAAVEPTPTVKRAVKRDASKKTGTGKSTPKAKKAGTPKRKKRAKKELSEEAKLRLAAKAEQAQLRKKTQKEKAKLRLQKKKDVQKIKDLKEAALSPPVVKQIRARHFVLKEHLQGAKNKEELKGGLSEGHKAFDSLTPSEREHYNHLANESNQKQAEELDAWLRSHTPQQIRRANLARNALRRIYGEDDKNKRSQKWAPLSDDRKPKGTRSAYTFFFAERFKDMAGIKPMEAAQLIANEWNALTESEKQKYVDMQKADRVRYVAESKDFYGSTKSEATPA